MLVGVVILCLVAVLAERTVVMLLHAVDATRARSFSEVATRAFNHQLAGIIVDVGESGQEWAYRTPGDRGPDEPGGQVNILLGNAMHRQFSTLLCIVSSQHG